MRPRTPIMDVERIARRFFTKAFVQGAADLIEAFVQAFEKEVRTRSVDKL